jgi:hypothetical protein
MADDGSGGWGFESLAARHQHRSSAALPWGGGQMEGRRTATQLRPRRRARLTPLRPPATPGPHRHRQPRVEARPPAPSGGAPASSGCQQWTPLLASRPASSRTSLSCSSSSSTGLNSRRRLAGRLHQRRRSHVTNAQGARTLLPIIGLSALVAAPRGSGAAAPSGPLREIGPSGGARRGGRSPADHLAEQAFCHAGIVSPVDARRFWSEHTFEREEYVRIVFTGL